MYFTDAISVLLRRWYVALLGLLLVAGGAAYTLTSVPTQYQASGEMLFLLPPDSTGPRTPSNPYINLVPGLTTTAALLATEANTKDVAAQLAEDGFTSEYSVALVPSTGPLLTISTTDTDAATAVAMRDRVMTWLRNRLEQRQEAVSVPPEQKIYTEDTNVGKEAEPLPGSKIRAVGAVVGAGMLLTLLAAFVVDRLLTRRRSRTELKLASVEEAKRAADRPPRPSTGSGGKDQPRNAAAPATRSKPAQASSTRKPKDAASNPRRPRKPADTGGQGLVLGRGSRFKSGG
jgi:hypothetical protein